MEIINKNIDDGTPFDWGRTSSDYAKYRDIYPQLFYDKIINRQLCITGQDVLDLGTGTGVIPRNLYRYGAKWTAIDISDEQIEQAKRLSEGMDINYYAIPAENIPFPDGYFDVITACQCFWYFDHKQVMPHLLRILKHILYLFLIQQLFCITRRNFVQFILCYIYSGIDIFTHFSRNKSRRY